MRKNSMDSLNQKGKEMKMMKKLFLFLLAASMICISTNAFAFPVVPGFDGIFFNNAEVLIDRDGSGSVSVGDTFWGTVQVQNIKASGADITGQTGPTIWTLGGGLAAPVEITGYFATDVVAVYPPGSPAPPNNTISAGSGTVATIILGPAATDPNGILSGGAVMSLYEGSVLNYNDGSQATALATATDGTNIGTLGLADGYWYTLAPTVPPGSGNVGESFAGLNWITVPSFLTPGLINDPNEDYSSNAGVPGGLDVNIYFNSEILQINPFPSSTLMSFGSNDPAVLAAVPEPSTLLMVGIGLLGIGLFRRKISKV